MKIKREVRLAVTAIITLVLLIWGINFLKAKDIFERNTVFYALYDQVDGLKVSSAVEYRGYHVGQVTKIQFIGERYDQVLVQFTVGKNLEIPINSKAIIQNTDLMGTKAICLEPGDSSVYAESGDTLRAHMQKGMLDQVTEQLRPLKNKAELVMVSLDSVLTTVQNIFNSETQTNIEGSLQRMHNTLKNVESASGSLDGLISGESGRISKILDNINSITENLRSNNSHIAQGLDNFVSITDSLRSADVGKMMGQVNHILGQVDSVVVKINHGAGTLGEVVNDDDLYYGLVSLSDNLDKLLTEFRANPKKFINLSVFNFSSNKDKSDPYGIVVFESDKPLPVGADLYVQYPGIVEYKSKGVFLYLIQTYPKLRQAEKDLENVKKDFKDAYIVKIN